ncbi:unnamed protein product [Calicophoron daubneyi]|uniref:Uncharacterized protein n=1 Tax=Calicophoron daubneyi TaxID=300641 RepID=A0AAV2T7G9_CALDB
MDLGDSEEVCSDEPLCSESNLSDGNPSKSLGSPQMQQRSAQNDEQSHSVIAKFLPEMGDISDNSEESTMDTVSYENVRHGTRLVRSHIKMKSDLLKKFETDLASREHELLDQVNILTRRLILANSRCESAMQVASQATAVQSELTNAIQYQKKLNNLNSCLTSELKDIRLFISKIPTDRLVYSTEGNDCVFEIDVSIYSQLRKFEAESLLRKQPDSLSTAEYLKMQLHKAVSLFSKEISRLRGQITEAAESVLVGLVPSSETFGLSPRRPNKILTDEVQIPSVRSQNIRSPQLFHAESDSDLSLGRRRVRFADASSQSDDPEQMCDIPFSADKFSFASEKPSSSRESPSNTSSQRRQIELLEQDKEYLLLQVSTLSRRIAESEKNLLTEREHVKQLKSENDDLLRQLRTDHEKMGQEFQTRLKLQAEELTKLTETELSKLRAANEETHKKEVDLVRKQRDEAVVESERLRSELNRTEKALQSLKEELENLGSMNRLPLSSSRTASSGRSDISTRKQMMRAAVEVQSARAGRADALLQVEKLSTQLDASRKAYYELESKSVQERVTLEARVRELEQKLSAYDTLEKELDEALESVSFRDVKSSFDAQNDWLSRFEQFCFEGKNPSKSGSLILPTLAARRLEHSMRLAKEIAQLKARCVQIEEERSEKVREAEMANKENERLGSLLTMLGQPADCLAAALAQRESQLGKVRVKLEQAESRIVDLTKECSRLTDERNRLARDLEKLLTRRQSLAKLKQQIMLLAHSPRSTKFGGKIYGQANPICEFQTNNATKRVFQPNVFVRNSDQQSLCGAGDALCSARPYDTIRS